MNLYPCNSCKKDFEYPVFNDPHQSKNERRRYLCRTCYLKIKNITWYDYSTMSKITIEREKIKEDFWVAWVWVSRAAEWMRYSRFFDTKDEARSHTEPMKGTKLIRVKVMIYNEKMKIKYNPKEDTYTIKEHKIF